MSRKSFWSRFVSVLNLICLGACASRGTTQTSAISKEQLIRRIDERHLEQVMANEKPSSAPHFLYIPYGDDRAWSYFKPMERRHPSWKLSVRRLPERVTPAYVRSLEGRHGLLSLALQKNAQGEIEGVPYVASGGRIPEMLGWESYFIALGLLEDDRVDLARAIADNLAYQTRYYGKILNANRSDSLTRTQTPILSSLIRAVYAKLPHTAANEAWLMGQIEFVVSEYRSVWTSPPKEVKGTGLSREFDEGFGPTIPLSLSTFFNRDRAADFLTVALNSFLFKIEKDVAELLKEVWGGKLVMGDGSIETTEVWAFRAARRAKAMQEFFWDEQRGTFLDYDLLNGQRSHTASATSLYPLWAGWAKPVQAARVVAFLKEHLEQKEGIAGRREESRGPLGAAHSARSWGDLYDLAPHQIFAWFGLSAYGFHDDAERLADKWLEALTRHAVDFKETISTQEGFGLMKASYQLGLKQLTGPSLERERRLKPRD